MFKNKHRLEIIRDLLNINKKSFAKSIGFSPQQYTNYIGKKLKLGYEVSERIVKKYKWVNLDFLLEKSEDIYSTNTEGVNLPIYNRLNELQSKRVEPTANQQTDLAQSVNSQTLKPQETLMGANEYDTYRRFETRLQVIQEQLNALFQEVQLKTKQGITLTPPKKEISPN